MKKFSVMAIAIVACLSFAACTKADPNEKLVKEYEKACKEGNTEKMIEVSTKLADHLDELTEEQNERILNAVLSIDYNTVLEEFAADSLEYDVEDWAE